MNLRIDYYEMFRLWIESLVTTYDINKIFIKNNDNAYTVNEIFDIVITPFYSNDPTFLPLVKAICDYWVIEGKVNRIEINGELFYHA